MVEQLNTLFCWAKFCYVLLLSQKNDKVDLLNNFINNYNNIIFKSSNLKVFI